MPRRPPPLSSGFRPLPVGRHHGSPGGRHGRDVVETAGRRVPAAPPAGYLTAGGAAALELRSNISSASNAKSAICAAKSSICADKILFSKALHAVRHRWWSWFVVASRRPQAKTTVGGQSRRRTGDTTLVQTSQMRVQRMGMGGFSWGFR